MFFNTIFNQYLLIDRKAASDKKAAIVQGAELKINTRNNEQSQSSKL